ncbi:MAG: 4-vinyl reductase [Anaerolineae bacterium SM23_ 63]|nr:MAG: 4-vinyl reductase [Anaerolineae bacterium SM23_ 63]
MASIDKSGYLYPNKAGRIYLQALEDVMGRNGVSAILNLAGLETWIDNYPPNDMERGIDFAELAAINAALDELYGPRSGHGMARRAGWATFDQALRNFGALAGVSDIAFKVLPLSRKVRIGLPVLARVFSHISDQINSVEEREDRYLYRIHRCPVCWGRQVDAPVCHLVTGLLEESLRWVSGGKNFRVQEMKCIAVGDEACEFVIDKTPID